MLLGPQVPVSLKISTAARRTLPNPIWLLRKGGGRVGQGWAWEEEDGAARLGEKARQAMPTPGRVGTGRVDRDADGRVRYATRAHEDYAHRRI